MLLEYHITYNCPVKKDIELSVFKDKVTNGRKAISTIHSLSKDINQDYKAMRKLPATSERLFDVLIMEKDTSLGELYDSYKPLDEQSSHCNACVLSCGKSFACYNRFTFPLSGAFEKWIVERIAKGNHKNLINYILSKKPRKSFYEDMRRQGFLERKEAIVRKFKIGFFKRIAFSSNDLFDFIFGEKYLSNGEMLLLLKASDLINVSKNPKEGYLKAKEHNYFVEWKNIKFDVLNSDNDYDQLLYKFYLSIVHGFYIEFCLLYHQIKRTV
jgi:hypothetical protein